MNNLGKAMIIAWNSLGVKIEREISDPNKLTIYISVPARSYIRDTNGKEMSGNYLSKRFKNVLAKYGLRQVKILSRIREDEYWSQLDKVKAEEEAKKFLERDSK